MQINLDLEVFQTLKMLQQLKLQLVRPYRRLETKPKVWWMISWPGKQDSNQHNIFNWINGGLFVDSNRIPSDASIEKYFLESMIR